LRTVPPAISDAALRKLTSFYEFPQKEIQLDPSFEYTAHNPNPANVEIFQTLQKMVKVGLVIPSTDEHMYDAAMNSNTCKLTALGYHYWMLVNKGRI
jgi:hypothetical protein